jgi:hypothetical protein
MEVSIILIGFYLLGLIFGYSNLWEQPIYLKIAVMLSIIRILFKFESNFTKFKKHFDNRQNG